MAVKMQQGGRGLESTERMIKPVALSANANNLAGWECKFERELGESGQSWRGTSGKDPSEPYSIFSGVGMFLRAVRSPGGLPAGRPPTCSLLLLTPMSVPLSGRVLSSAYVLAPSKQDAAPWPSLRPGVCILLTAQPPREWTRGESCAGPE